MEKILSVEFDKQGETVEIHLNDLGMNSLIEHLQQLRKYGKTEHTHLMTKDWGGGELTNERQNTIDSIQLINHLKIFYWDD